MKQETIEEAVETYYEENIDQSNIPREHYECEIQDLMIGFAVEWQQERSYSKEDILINIELAMIQGLTLGGYRDLLIEQL